MHRVYAPTLSRLLGVQISRLARLITVRGEYHKEADDVTTEDKLRQSSALHWLYLLCQFCFQVVSERMAVYLYIMEMFCTHANFKYVCAVSFEMLSSVIFGKASSFLYLHFGM